ncbi:hypothetical protein [Nocardia sp. SC052]|uniref:hypothetical protein n=1 Tax=Nocardia sichangensis TaxID=3385975 RepID=UPI0039A3A40A
MDAADLQAGQGPDEHPPRAEPLPAAWAGLGPRLGPTAVAQSVQTPGFDDPPVTETVDQARRFEHVSDHVTYWSVWRDRLAVMVQVGDRVLLVANGVSVFEVLELDEEGYALVESVLEDSPGRYPFTVRADSLVPTTSET